jgi:hypothetical protein
MRSRRLPSVLALLALLALVCSLAPSATGAVERSSRSGVSRRGALPCDPGEAAALAAPPAGTAYHTAYFSPTPDEVTVNEGTITDFETLTGTQLAGVYFSDHWGRGGKVTIDFPAQKVETIWSFGAIPMVRMMPWMLWHVKDNPITLRKLLAGTFDRKLKDWFRDARDTRIPLLLDFGVEMNGRWFPWNGLWNGGGRRDAYGSRRYPDGPERFRDAYRKLVRMSRDLGANNLTWNFHVDANSWPDVWWNRSEWYYPGDAFVDWITLSSYGEQVPTGRPRDWNAFRDNLGDPDDPQSDYAQIRDIAPQKPFGVIEFGVTEDPDAGDKAAWIADAYADMTPPGARYGAELISYWSEKWRNGDGSVSDLRVDSSPAALQAYRDAIADASLRSTPAFDCS